MIFVKYNDVCAQSLYLLYHPFYLMAEDKHSWRRMRRASHDALTKTSVAEFHPILAKEAVRVIDGILHNPSRWNMEFLRWV